MHMLYSSNEYDQLIVPLSFHFRQSNGIPKSINPRRDKHHKIPTPGDKPLLNGLRTTPTIEDTVEELSRLNLKDTDPSAEHQIACPQLSSTHFSYLFPFHLVIDDSLQIKQIGRTLQRLCPNFQLGRRLPELVDIIYPRILFEFPIFQQFNRAVFVLQVKKSEHSIVFRLKGKLPITEACVCTLIEQCFIFCNIVTVAHISIFKPLLLAEISWISIEFVAWRSNDIPIKLGNAFPTLCRNFKRGSVITVTSQWARWHLKSSASRLFPQPFVQRKIKESIKAPRHWPFLRESTGDRWIPLT